MKKNIITAGLILTGFLAKGQLNPAITSWLQNINTTGYYYPNALPATLTANNIQVNCQEVSYSATYAYVKTKGIPSYPTGPFKDGNINQAGNQNAIFRFPLSPQQNTGTATATNLGNIAVFINGVAGFDPKDGVSWKSSTNAWAGGPLGGAGDGIWYRDAIVYEKGGFDCSKGHPAGTNYHHHQNPSAFKYDLNVISAICNPYDAEGLYSINSSLHSPLIGFAYDGFPIYGAYGYKNADGTGGIVRMKSGYQLRSIATRNTINGASVTAGPPINATYPLGSCIQDYEWVSHTGQDDYLDSHNGRFCITPEYPSGIYCYFATVDANHNSAYPYIIGPTYYGIYANRKVASIAESVTIYSPGTIPISLVSFSGKKVNNKNVLTWVTASEAKSKHFIVQRSTDGSNFLDIGLVSAAGNSTRNKEYGFVDEHIQSNALFYYRLMFVDLDGKSGYSNIILLKNNADFFNFNVLPNPASDLLIVQYNNGVLRFDTNVKLYDMSGKLVRETNIIKGQTLAYINTETLYSGTYVVKLHNSAYTENFKVVISK